MLQFVVKAGDLYAVAAASSQSRPANHDTTINQPSLIPGQYAWPALPAGNGDELLYRWRYKMEALVRRNGNSTYAPILDGRRTRGSNRELRHHLAELVDLGAGKFVSRR